MEKLQKRNPTAGNEVVSREVLVHLATVLVRGAEHDARISSILATTEVSTVSSSTRSSSYSSRCTLSPPSTRTDGGWPRRATVEDR